MSLSANLPRGLRLPEKRLVKQLTPNVCSKDYTYTIITKGRTSLLFQFFMRVVEVLGLEKAKRFQCYDCDEFSATSAKISIYFQTTLIVSRIFCKSRQNFSNSAQNPPNFMLLLRLRMSLDMIKKFDGRLLTLRHLPTLRPLRKGSYTF